ncbi:MAG: hypothetical protein UR89_C0043G0002 [Candidatus Roizmanbacteria bacterium GW2011_GWA2_35_8]|uniref:Glyoxylate reductase n=1 Tax=Candidatus Roizmanbacteria bacterium GW2011_GWA2_35_8 TaxID=1618479 RepID=A0A0G0G1V8_9BACT|nr:MAG: hypothetical protein UR89_C0043G0002 [Candidatus Roizmanbacteria bacterium GW2011_GWA2_35_8]
MKLHKIALIDFDTDFFDKQYLNRIKSLTKKLIFVKELNIKKRNNLIKDASALLIRYSTSLDKAALDNTSNLKYIGASSIAVDQVDTKHAHEKGINITNIPGYSSNPIAEFVFGALIDHFRHLAESKKNVEQGDFTVHTEYKGWELAGKTFGIIGLGNIGKRVAEIALGFNMKVQYYSRTRKKDYEKMEVKYVPLEKLISTSNILGVFLELNNKTKNFVTEKYLNHIKKSTIVISTSHTDIFDFDALTKSLIENKFIFAQTYFDSISKEHRDRLHKSPNTILYPSIAIQTFETKKRQQEMVVNNLENFCRGKIINEVT